MHWTTNYRANTITMYPARVPKKIYVTSIYKQYAENSERQDERAEEDGDLYRCGRVVVNAGVNANNKNIVTCILTFTYFRLLSTC